MNKGIIIALAIGVIAWLVIHMNRRQPQRNIREMSIKDPAPLQGRARLDTDFFHFQLSHLFERRM